MKDLNDNTLRQQLIQRYLDGETTVEEEQALARFYQLSDGKFSAEEEAVRQLLLSINHLADDFTLSDEKAREFDLIVANTQQKARRIVLWPWLVAACVAGIVMIIRTSPESEKDGTAEPRTVQTTQPKKGKPQKTPLADTSEMMPQSFLVTLPSSKASPHPSDTEDDQSDLISVDSVFGVTSCPDPMAEYIALSEKLKRECDEVFQTIDYPY